MVVGLHSCSGVTLVRDSLRRAIPASAAIGVEISKGWARVLPRANAMISRLICSHLVPALERRVHIDRANRNVRMCALQGVTAQRSARDPFAVHCKAARAPFFRTVHGSFRRTMGARKVEWAQTPSDRAGCRRKSVEASLSPPAET